MTVDESIPRPAPRGQTGRAELEGERLIFLVSQPRAGSTMFQRMLGNHPDVHTVAEPWLMLPPLFSLTDEPIHAPYSPALARRACNDVLSGLPDGRGVYLEGVRRMTWHIYEQVLDESGKQLFLDKTPRYYYILPELRETFPRAKVLLLIRNPLAVLCSMLFTWASPREVWHLSHCRDDLLEAPQRMLHAIDSLGGDLHVVHYESLVREPCQVLPEVCRFLGIASDEQMHLYGQGSRPRGQLGDCSETLRKGKPLAANVDQWQDRLGNPQTWRLAHDYLEELGPGVMGQLGYDYQQLRETLDTARPKRRKRVGTLSLSKVMRWRDGEFSTWRKMWMAAMRIATEDGPLALPYWVSDYFWRRRMLLKEQRGNGRQTRG